MYDSIRCFRMASNLNCENRFRIRTRISYDSGQNPHFDLLKSCINLCHNLLIQRCLTQTYFLCMKYMITLRNETIFLQISGNRKSSAGEI
jgi:hypothetical protein